MSSETLLTDLCKICLANPPKYKCPRCSSATCSLACSKRHKILAACSGVRNPAAYEPRGALATPQSIDRDFNFLTSVERGLERSEKQLAGRGIHLGTPEASAARKPWTGHSRFEAACLRSKVDVRRASKGLSRARENKSRWHSGALCLEWSVEWVFPDGSHRISQAVEGETVERAGQQAWKQANKKAQPHHKRRKHFHGTPAGRDGVTKPENGSRLQSKDGRPTSGALDQPGVTTGESNVSPLLASTLDVTTPTPVENSEEPSGRPDVKEGLPTEGGLQKDTETSKDALEMQKAAQTETGPPTRAGQEGPPSHNYYYIHVPNRPGVAKVVASVAGETTLKSVLEGRTVLEFPTIYISTLAPNELGKEFILEEDWLKTAREWTTAGLDAVGAEGEDGWRRANGEHSRAEKGDEINIENVEGEDVLASLNRDVVGMGAGHPVP